MSNPVREQLNRYRNELILTNPTRANWGAVELWLAGIRPFLRRHFPDDVVQFDELSREPKWVSRVGVGGGPEPAQNYERGKAAKAKLLAFLDSVLRLAEDKGPEKVTAPVLLDHTAPTSSSPRQAASQKEPAMPDARNVFVIHGRNMAARDAMFDFLRACGLNPIEWGEAVQMTGKGAPYIGEVLDAAFGNAQAVVALLTPDDVVHLREELQQAHDPDYEKNPTPQARPNVLFEAGMAFGRHTERTLIVEIGQLRPFSDVAGKHAIRFRGTPEKRTELRDRLKTAGCAVKDAGSDWLTAGNFDEALRLAGPIASKAPRKRTPRAPRRPIAPRPADGEDERGEPPDGETEARDDTVGDRSIVGGQSSQTTKNKRSVLSPEAVEILSKAAAADGERKGMIAIVEWEGMTLRMGDHQIKIPQTDKRTQAFYKHLLDQMVTSGFLKRRPPEGPTTVFEVTHQGFLVADEITCAQRHGEGEGA